jgi:hypothetical protein
VRSLTFALECLYSLITLIKYRIVLLGDVSLLFCAFGWHNIVSMIWESMAMTQQWMFTTIISCFAFCTQAQVKSDHELVKDGNPVSGMTVQQAKKQPESVPVSETKTDIEPRVPLLQENTMDDEEFDSWRAADMFKDDEGEPSPRIDTVRRTFPRSGIN